MSRNRLISPLRIAGPDTRIRSEPVAPEVPLGLIAWRTTNSGTLRTSRLMNAWNAANGRPMTIHAGTRNSR